MLALKTAVAVALLAPRLAAAAGSVEQYRRLIITQRDPAAAKEFLRRPDQQAAVKREDPVFYAALFQEAAHLKDVSDLLANQLDAPSLRMALAVRPQSDLCQKPWLLLAWIAKHEPAVGGKRVEEAVWQWSALPPAPRAYLDKEGISERQWAGTTFDKRQARLGLWAKARFNALMKQAPKTGAEAAAMRQEAWIINGALTGSDRYVLWDQVKKAEAAVSGLSDAEKRVKKFHDSKLDALLAQAKAAGDLDGTLSALGRLFDGLKVENKTVARERPATAGERLAENQKPVLAAMLKESLLREIGGTWAAEELIPFYKKHTLKLAIRPLRSSSIGQYQDSSEEIVFNEKFIEEYVKTSGLSPQSLLSDSAALRTLVVQLSPLFVHEAYHQVQDKWAEGSGAVQPVSQARELESMQVEGVFILQKLAYDKKFRKIMEDRQAFSSLAAESLQKARALEKNPELFRAEIMTWYYPHRLSLEGNAWTNIQALRRKRDELRATGFVRRLLKSPQLREIEAKLSAAEQAYALSEKRLEIVNAQTDRRVALSKKGSGKPEKPVVPSPGVKR